MPPRSIKIKQYTFHIEDRFAVGHPLTEGEAQALNSLRAENIRNNFAKGFQAELDALEPGRLLGAEALAAAQVRLAAYAANYEFQQRHVPKPRDPLTSEIEAIVGELVAEATNARGAPTEAELSSWRSDPRVRASAQARIEARAQSASAALAELL